MSLVMPAFALAWTVLLGGPIWTGIVASRSLHEVPLMQLAIRSVAVLATVAAAWGLSVEFSWRVLNWLSLASAYVAWCGVVGFCFGLRPRVLGITAGTIASLSLAPGIILSTVGFLGLLFIVGDYADVPAEHITLAPGLDCAVTNWGNVTSDDGHEVHIYRYLPWFPLVRRQVERVVVDETRPWNGIPASTGCREVAATL